MCDQARRIWHHLFSVFPDFILISWGQTPALGTESVTRSRQGGNVPLAALHPMELLPPEAAGGGDALSGRSVSKFS